VVITGGSQGMGRALGKLLAQKGANIVIVARDRQKLDAALKYISVCQRTPLSCITYLLLAQASAKDPEKQRFHYISADVTKSEENIRIIDEVTEWNNGHPPDVVWANAGSSHPELFIDTSIDILRSQMDINFWSAAYLAHATLRCWLKPTTSKQTAESASTTPKRHFIITSSAGAFCGFVGYSPYSPGKAASRNLADALRNEILMYNGYRSANSSKGPAADVEIHCVAPGTILSPGFENENKTKPKVTLQLEETDPRQTEDEVAAVAVKGLENGEFLIATQWLGKILRAGMLGATKRTSIFIDMVVTWITPLVWMVMIPDADNKVWRWGEQNEIKLPQ
jgi:3-dehydrosphinganine reductase